MKIEIKSTSGVVLFEYESDNNSISKTVVEAVKSEADLREADLGENELSKLKSYTQVVPEVGSFIGWKKAEGKLIELLIPEDAKRHTYIGSRKCRAEFVKVINITLNGRQHEVAITNDYGPKTVYRIGEIVRPDSYDSDPRNECSNGIHFFITKQEALDY